MGAEMVQADVLTEVTRLRGKFPSYVVKTTGHSLGAALTHLTSMMLIKNGVEVA